MIVKDFMKLWADNVSMKVYQIPIKEIDKCSDLICRQVGSVDVLYNSNQNYLDFEIVNLQSDDGLIIVTCEANEKQKQEIINSHKDRRPSIRQINNLVDELFTQEDLLKSNESLQDYYEEMNDYLDGTMNI